MNLYIDSKYYTTKNSEGYYSDNVDYITFAYKIKSNELFMKEVYWALKYNSDLQQPMMGGWISLEDFKKRVDEDWY